MQHLATKQIFASHPGALSGLVRDTRNLKSKYLDGIQPHLICISYTYASSVKKPIQSDYQPQEHEQSHRLTPRLSRFIWKVKMMT